MEASAFQNNKSFWHVFHAAASKLSVSFSCQYQKNPPKLFAPADQSKRITVISKALIFPLNGFTSFETPVPDRGEKRVSDMILVAYCALWRKNQRWT